MSGRDRALFGPERKPWEPPADDRLAPSDYAASAVFGVMELAYEHAYRASGAATPAAVAGYAKVFAWVLIKAQLETGEAGGWSSSLSVRLRGALRTVLSVRPDWPDQGPPEAWRQELLDDVLLIARGAAWLYALKPSEVLA